MDDAVRQPSQNIQDRMLVGGHDVADVGAVDDVLKSRKNANPNVRAPLRGNESAILNQRCASTVASDHRPHVVPDQNDILASVEQDQPGQRRKKRQKELSGYRENQRDHQQCSQRRFSQGTGLLNDREGKDSDDDEHEVLRVVNGPPVRPQ